MELKLKTLQVFSPKITMLTGPGPVSQLGTSGGQNWRPVQTFWWLIRVTLVVTFCFLSQNGWEVTGTYKSLFLLENECRVSGGNSLKWWEHSMPTYNKLIHLNIHTRKVWEPKTSQSATSASTSTSTEITCTHVWMANLHNLWFAQDTNFNKSAVVGISRLINDVIMSCTQGFPLTSKVWSLIAQCFHNRIGHHLGE